ncbi:ATP-binding cassette sub-family B member 6, mitochondrial [Galdieria sulphuraria]|nr:ATP-binding cassette sub-family B member 6, mitochondrial [Galdieria sulphuraria]
MKFNWRWFSNLRRKEIPYHSITNGVSTSVASVDNQGFVIPLNNSVSRDSAQTPVNYSQVASYILPHLWPEGSLLKFRVLFCLLLVFLAKFANFLTPLALRSAVDFLGRETEANPSNSFLTSFVKFPNVYISVLAYALLRLTSTMLGELRQGVWQRVSQVTTRSLAVRSFSHILELSYEFHLGRKTGDIVSTLDRGINSISTLLGTFVFTLGPTIIELLLVCSVFVSLGSLLLAFTTALSVIAYGVWSVWLSEWRRSIRRQVNAKDNMVREKTVEAFGNFETVKYFCSENFETQRYMNAVEEYFEVSRKSQWSLSLLNSGQSLWICLGLGSAMLLTASRVMSGAESVGTFVMVNAYILQLYQPLSFLGTAYRMISSALTDLEKLILLLREQPDIQDKPEAPSLKCQGGEVVFERVSFSYKQNARGIHNISFHVPAGSTLAIVGVSGAGKSTITKLLFRLYDPDSGSIRIDNQLIGEVRQDSLRQAIGIVAQDTGLFHDTIRFNIQYSKPDASDEEVIEAAKVARIHDFICSLPNGYETIVGERGLRLSGGEKQRVAVARAVLKNPSILVLDEATSALDTETERAIQTSLMEVSKNRTTIIIAHRLSTVIHANNILVLQDGFCVEQGTHEELLSYSDVHRNLAALSSWSFQRRGSIMVQLQLSSEDRSQIRYVLERCLEEEPTKQKLLLNVIKEETISHQDLYEITLSVPQNALPPFRFLVARCSWSLPPPKCPYDNYQRSPLLEERLKVLRQRHEQKRYRELIQDLPSFTPNEASMAVNFQSFWEQLTLGLQVLTSMVTGFIFGYYVAWKLTKNQTIALVWGLVAFICAMFVDVFLIITGLLAKDMMTLRTTKSKKNK